MPDADIILEPIAPTKSSKKNVKAKADGSFAFEDLRPGRYKLSASFAGYQPQEIEITIRPDKIAVESIALKKVTYDFSIQTNIETGEVRFAPAKVIGQNPDGTLKSQETGGYCVVPIENQKAVIEELPEGTYNIDVRASDAPEYEPSLAVIEIPQDIPQANPDEPNENKLFRINLLYTLSTGTFNQIRTQDAWILPKNWKVDTKGLKADDVGIALPKNKDYRFYKDFEMQATVRLLDNASIGFVVRAKDENNHYLIQLTGASSKNPYFISGYIVKDGKLELVVTNPAPFLNKIIGEQKYFGVIIKAKGNTFEVLVEETATGNSYPLGNIVFKDNNFPIGAVGIGILEKSDFEVGLFSVCYSYCK